MESLATPLPAWQACQCVPTTERGIEVMVMAILALTALVQQRNASPLAEAVPAAAQQDWVR